MKKHNPKPSNKRRLKIATRYISRASWEPAIFPEIRLCGKWLQDIGFSCGDMVTVQHLNNQIIISRDIPAA